MVDPLRAETDLGMALILFELLTFLLLRYCSICPASG